MQPQHLVLQLRHSHLTATVLDAALGQLDRVTVAYTATEAGGEVTPPTPLALPHIVQSIESALKTLGDNTPLTTLTTISGTTPYASLDHSSMLQAYTPTHSATHPSDLTALADTLVSILVHPHPPLDTALIPAHLVEHAAALPTRRDITLSLSFSEDTDTDTLIVCVPSHHAQRAVSLGARVVSPLFPLPLASLPVEQEGEMVLAVFEETRYAPVRRALRDRYGNGRWKQFLQLAAIIPPGGAIGNDDKLYDVPWSPAPTSVSPAPPYASSSTSPFPTPHFPPASQAHTRPPQAPAWARDNLVRFENGVAVHEYRDLRANPRCAFEAQLMGWYRLLCELGVVGGGPLWGREDDVQREGRVVLLRDTGESPAIAQIFTDIFDLPVISSSVSASQGAALIASYAEYRASTSPDLHSRTPTPETGGPAASFSIYAESLLEHPTHTSHPMLGGARTLSSSSAGSGGSSGSAETERSAVPSLPATAGELRRRLGQPRCASRSSTSDSGYASGCIPTPPYARSPSAGGGSEGGGRGEGYSVKGKAPLGGDDGLGGIPWPKPAPPGALSTRQGSSPDLALGSGRGLGRFEAASPPPSSSGELFQGLDDVNGPGGHTPPSISLPLSLTSSTPLTPTTPPAMQYSPHASHPTHSGSSWLRPLATPSGDPAPHAIYRAMGAEHHRLA
ncbi:hypothetical protein IAT38_003069 [Cryptococcus sp. DSM 104549]